MVGFPDLLIGNLSDEEAKKTRQKEILVGLVMILVVLVIIFIVSFIL